MTVMERKMGTIWITTESTVNLFVLLNEVRTIYYFCGGVSSFTVTYVVLFTVEVS